MLSPPKHDGGAELESDPGSSNRGILLVKRNILRCRMRGAFEPHFPKGRGAAKIRIQPVARASAEHKVWTAVLLYRTLTHFEQAFRTDFASEGEVVTAPRTFNCAKTHSVMRGR